MHLNGGGTSQRVTNSSVGTTLNHGAGTSHNLANHNCDRNCDTVSNDITGVLGGTACDKRPLPTGIIHQSKIKFNLKKLQRLRTKLARDLSDSDSDSEHCDKKSNKCDGNRDSKNTEKTGKTSDHGESTETGHSSGCEEFLLPAHGTDEAQPASVNGEDPSTNEPSTSGADLPKNGVISNGLRHDYSDQSTEEDDNLEAENKSNDAENNDADEEPQWMKFHRFRNRLERARNATRKIIGKGKDLKMITEVFNCFCCVVVYLQSCEE